MLMLAYKSGQQHPSVRLIYDEFPLTAKWSCVAGPELLSIRAYSLYTHTHTHVLTQTHTQMRRAHPSQICTLEDVIRFMCSNQDNYLANSRNHMNQLIQKRVCVCVCAVYSWFVVKYYYCRSSVDVLYVSKEPFMTNLNVFVAKTMCQFVILGQLHRHWPWLERGPIMCAGNFV